MKHIPWSLVLGLATLAAACASQQSARTAPDSVVCGYESAFNRGLVEARAQHPMNSQPLEASCRSDVALTDARRGYREGYMRGVGQVQAAPPAVAPPAPALNGASTLNATTLRYRPWYHNELGWGLAGAAVALGVGAGFAELSYQDVLGRVLCEGALEDCEPFPTRARLAADADVMKSGRNILVGLSVGALAASILTFALWKRPLEQSVPISDSADLRIAPSFSPTGASLQGVLTF